MKNLSLFLFIITFSFVIKAQQSGILNDPRDGKTYKTVKIGNQLWMSENLAFKTDSGCCWAYSNDTSNISKYGYLYNWGTAKNVCSNGWHLPTKEEFETLLNNFGGEGETSYRALLPSGNSGFSALFGGFRFCDGDFYYIGLSAIFWSSSPHDAEGAWNLDISIISSGANMRDDGSSCGFFVRCLKDN